MRRTSAPSDTVALLGAQVDSPIREATIHKQSASAIRAGKWKLKTHLGSGGFSKPTRVRPEPGGPRGQLYNIEDDPGETKNLWSQQPQAVRRLTGPLQRYREQGRSVPLVNGERK